MALSDDLDRRVVAIGAAIPLAVILPLRLVGAPPESLAAAILVAFPMTGVVTTLKAPTRPLVHATVAAALAALVTTMITIVRRATGDGLTALSIVSLLVYVQIAVAAAVLASIVTGWVQTMRGREA